MIDVYFPAGVSIYIVVQPVTTVWLLLFYLSWFSMYEACAYWCIFGEWFQYIHLVYAEIHFELS